MFLAIDLLVWLFIIEAGLFFGIAAANDREWDGFSAFLALIGVGLAFWFTGTNPLTWFNANIGSILTGIVAWVAAGAATASFKWWTVVNSPEVQAEIKQAHADWVRAKSDSPFQESYQFKQFTVLQNAGSLIRWAIYWPMTLAWMVSYRLIRWIGIKVFEALKNLYQLILSSAVNKALKDLKV